MIFSQWPNHPVELTAHSARFSGCFLRFRLWAAAHRERSAALGCVLGGRVRWDSGAAAPPIGARAPRGSGGHTAPPITSLKRHRSLRSRLRCASPLDLGVAAPKRGDTPASRGAA